MRKERREFAECAAKSCFSFLQGASQPWELFERAQFLGYQAIGLTDLHGFYGMVRAYQASKSTSLKLLVGCEIEIEEARLILLAKNFTGYKQICRLLSEGFKESKTPRLFRQNLIPWVNQNTHLLLPPRHFPSQDLFSFLRNLAQPTQLITRYFHPDRDEPLKAWLKNLPSEIPRAWTWDPHFHTKERFEVFEVLQSIRLQIPLSERRPAPNAENYLKPLSELDRLQVPKDWTDQNMRISESCEFSPAEIKYHYPREWLPPHQTPASFLRQLCESGLKTRYPQGASSKVLHQLEHELQLVAQLQYEDYFLTVWDIVKFARSKNILCQGRGSAANSVICYLLEITAIDPVQMNLLFERFISKERNEAPDIDIDFEHERREEVIQYIYQKYGRERSALVATLITYRTRSALRDVGKALQISPDLIELYSKKSTWRENVFEEPAHSNTMSEKEKLWLRISHAIRGFPRHLGQHTGGMILTADRLDEISPIQNASMPGRTTVQWDKYDIESLGLLKIDLLSLGILTCIRKALQLVKTYAPELQLHQIPHEDSKTYAMIQKSHTVGVFQIESRAQMSMIPRLKPQNFYDLVIEVGIVRPGPIQGGMVHPYLRRRWGLEKVTYAHPKLKPILEKTLGIPIFQEQVMKMAIEVAGYSPGEADALRRAMGAWKKRGNLEEHAENLRKRLIAHQISPDFAQKICHQILGFGEYGFPESHAASFALLTYASAYLKAHHPAAFLCGLLNSMPMGFYPFHMLLSSFQREGVVILPVHTEFSEWDHKLERISDVHEHHSDDGLSANGCSSQPSLKTDGRFSIPHPHSVVEKCPDVRRQGARSGLYNDVHEHRSDDGNKTDGRFSTTLYGVRLGFRCIRHLSQAHAQSFIENRKRGRLDLYIFDAQERAALAMVSEIDSKRENYWKFLKDRPGPLEGPSVKRSFPKIHEFDAMILDFQFMEASLHSHPAELVKRYAWKYSISSTQICLSSELAHHSDSKRRFTYVFGVVQVLQSPPTAKGMFFITLEDESGFINLVIQPQIYQKFKDIIQSSWTLLAYGSIQKTFGSDYISVLVTEILRPAYPATKPEMRSRQWTEAQSHKPPAQYTHQM